MLKEEIFTSKQLSSWGILKKVKRELLIDKFINSIKSPEKKVLEDIQKIWLKEIGISSEEELQNWEKKQGVSKNEWQGLLIRQWKWLEWCKENVSDKIPSHYLKRKPQLDKVIYSLLRVKDKYLANELFLRIKNNENSFKEISSEFSEGPEKKSGGRLGPIPLNKPHPLLAKLLQVSQPGQLWPPKELGEWWIVVRMEKLICTELTDNIKQKLLLELGEEVLLKDLNSDLNNKKNQFELK
tara:strand:- start:1804 stop:2523 length:720 start_codon:yes stop_codon:yes gene_type:complete